jgi:hypothetical protein
VGRRDLVGECLGRIFSERKLVMVVSDSQPVPVDSPAPPALDLKHVGRVLKLAAAIVESADKHGVIQADGAMVFTDPQAVAEFAGDVLVVLQSNGITLPGSAGKVVKKLPALLALVED